jgi:hypothetical protein
MKKVKRKSHWPKWAKYKATGKDGSKFLYSHKPRIYKHATKRWFLGNDLVMLLEFEKERQISPPLPHSKGSNFKGKWKKSLRKIEG